MLDMPIITLEVSRMKYGIQHALSQHHFQVSEEIKNAVDRFCEPENINRIIQTQASAILEKVIKEEIDNFFRTGDGRAVIAEAVQTSLSKNLQTGDDNES